MYPQQPPNTPPPSYNYLDEIAAPQPVKTINPLAIWGIIGGVLLLVVIALMLLFSNGAPSTTERLSQMQRRVASLKSTVQESSSNIKDSKLRAQSSSLSSILSGMSADLATNIGELTEAKENDPIAVEFNELSETLNDARLNERFDATYAREVTFQIKKLRADMAIIYKEVDSSDLKEALQRQDSSLDTLAEDFSGFNEK